MPPRGTCPICAVALGTCCGPTSMRRSQRRRTADEKNHRPNAAPVLHLAAQSGDGQDQGAPRGAERFRNVAPWLADVNSRRGRGDDGVPAELNVAGRAAPAWL